MQQAQCVHLVWRKHPRDTSHVYRVGHAACKMLCFSWNNFSMLFLLNLLKNLNLCTSYIKQIMNVSHLCNGTNISFRERWNVPFNSASPCWMQHFIFHTHENICTIALINIHYLYTIQAWDRTQAKKEEKAQKGGKIINRLYLCTWMKKWNWRIPPKRR